LLAALVCLAPRATPAQAPSPAAESHPTRITLHGVVRDPAGSPIPSARVTVTDIDGPLRHFQDDYLQTRDIGEVLGIRREQSEFALDCLRCKPQVVHADVRVSSGSLDLCSENSKRFSRFDRDSQLGLSSQPAEHGRSSLLLYAGPQKLETEPDLGDVDGREIDRFLPSDGMYIGGTERATFHGDPEAGIDQPAHGVLNSDTRPRRVFRWEEMAADNASAVSSSSVRYRSPNTLRASWLGASGISRAMCL
jgi:hypothetical protein